MELRTETTFDELFNSTPGELVAQQVSNNGAIHVLEQLKRTGVTVQNVDAMLVGLKQSLDVVQYCSDNKGVRLELENYYDGD